MSREVGSEDDCGGGGAVVSLSDEVRGHHTAWVALSGGAGHSPVAVRYAVAGESLVMFGDRELAGVADGSQVVVTIHEIHDGPPLARFSATLRDVDPSEVDGESLGELLAHVSLGRDLAAVNEHLDEIRAHRRVVSLTV
jgi:hypothetical protein